MPVRRPGLRRSLSAVARLALRRVSKERSLEYTEPFSQQGIVEAAICNWLRRAGHGVRENRRLRHR
jgi:hypothetical protein